MKKNEKKKIVKRPRGKFGYRQKKKKNVIPKRWGLWVGPSWSAGELDYRRNQF